MIEYKKSLQRVILKSRWKEVHLSVNVCQIIRAILMFHNMKLQGISFSAAHNIIDRFREIEEISVPME